MKADRILSLIGLAQKAGKVASGEFSTENAVKSRKAKLVMIAKDASENTKKKFKDKCTFYKVPFYIYGSKYTLGHALGKRERACAAVLDNGFAKSLLSLFGGKYGENSDHEAN